MPPEQILEELRESLSRKKTDMGMSEAALARFSQLSVAGFHEFLSGQNALGLRTWQALYRTHPDLRWILEEYQRQSALHPSEEVAETGPSRRRAV